MIVCDVDGVLTDGSIVLGPDGTEWKRFHVRDGFALRAWMGLGHEVGIITGRGGPAVRARAAELGITHVVEGSKDKVRDLELMAKQAGIGLEEIAFMGDDWPDAGAMRRAGFAIAPVDASAEIVAMADLVTAAAGGCGAVREALMYLLDARGQRDEVRTRYHL
jgi:3-deoxy-D-manno-octulosonate 8-phosphate phosphatase (KDO 8-P phosphatase)